MLNLQRSLKLVKLFLVSPELQKVLLLSLTLIYPLIEMVTYLSSSSHPILLSDINHLFSLKQFTQISTASDYFSYLQQSVLPNIYTNFPKPLSILTYPVILQTLISSQSTTLPCYEDVTAVSPILCSASVSLTAAEQALIAVIFAPIPDTPCAAIGAFASYTSCQFAGYLGRLNYTSVLTSMKTHGWLSSVTAYSVFEISWRNARSPASNIAYLRLIIETDSSSGRIASRFMQFGSMNIGSPMITIMFLLYLIVINIIYTLKILLESNLSFDKWTFVGHLVNITASWVYVTASIILQVLASTVNSTSLAPPTVQKVREFEDMLKIKTLAMLIVFTILPFRAFAYFTQFRYFRWLKKFANIVFKTFPGMFITAFVLAILYFFSVTTNYSKLYSDQSRLESSANTALFGSLLFNEQEAVDDAFDRVRDFLPYHYLFPAFAHILSSCIEIYLLAFFIDLMRRSSQIEFRHQSNFQEEFNHLLADLDDKIEHTKEVISEVIHKDEEESNSQEKERILLYFPLKGSSHKAASSSLGAFQQLDGEGDILSSLEVQVGNVTAAICAAANTTLRNFESLADMVQFIYCLTNIRTEYLSPSSAERFRILFYLDDANYFTDPAVSALVSFLNDLSKRNCSHYPILFYSTSFIFPHSIEVSLRGFYRQTICSNRPEILETFCSMQQTFSALQNAVIQHKEPSITAVNRLSYAVPLTAAAAVYPHITPFTKLADKNSNGQVDATVRQQEETEMMILIGMQNRSQQLLSQQQPQQSSSLPQLLQQQQLQIQPQNTSLNTFNTFKSTNSQESRDLSNAS